MMELVLICGVISGASAFYEDYLTHSALENVPAVIGQDVQLRCTKIIEKQYDDVMYTPRSCSPEWQESCYHAWSKDGMVIKENQRFEIYSSMTYDYCDSFEKTSQVVSSIIPGQSGDIGGYVSRDMTCYASILKIKNVKLSDFGVYTCNLSLHEPDPYWDSYADESKSIVLYDADKTEDMFTTPSVHYLEASYVKSLKGQLLLQCTTIGDSLTWIFYEFYCDETDKCMPKAIEIDDRENLPHDWNCFEFHYGSHSPFTGVIESFIYFQNICPTDYLEVNCAVSVNGILTSNYSNRIFVKEDKYWFHHYPDYMFGVAIAIGSSTFIPTVFTLMIVASIIACVRAKLCCSRREQQFITIQQSPVTGHVPH